eukprot:6633279-Ditylum_brightwellii.AAC.1
MDVQADNYELDVIVDHHFKDGILILKTRNYSESNNSKDVWEAPFNALKKDTPLEVARYIQNHVTEASRKNGHYTTWTRNILKQATRSVKRMHHLFGADKNYRSKVARRSGQDCQLVRNYLEACKEDPQNEQVKKKLSRNVRNKKNKIQEKIGIKIPGNAKEALFLDKKNGNNKWAEAILKEMGALN